MAEFINIIDRIKELKSIKTDNAVAGLLNISQSAFAERKRKDSIPYEELVSFSVNEGISIDWLLTGLGRMRRDGGEPFRVSEEPAQYEVGEFCVVPQVRGEISAGGGLAPDSAVEMKVAFRRDWIQRHGDPRNMSLIRVTGDSMEPTLFSGDLVLVDHGRNYIDPQGGIYAIAMDHTIMIKRIQVVHTTGKVRIISDNPRYEVMEASPDQIAINGRIIWFGREIEK